MIFARARARIAFVALASVGVVHPAQAATHFAFPSAHDSGTAPTSIVAADFNGDGRLDLAIAYTLYLPGNNGKVGIQINNGGSPPFPLNVGAGSDPPGGAYTVGKNPVHIATGVFNGSGRKDLAVVNQGDASISILLNNGSGVFAVSGTTLTTGTNPGVIAVGDFNGDGKDDIAVTNTGSNTVSVFLGNGSGGFAAASSPTFATGSQPMGIDAADMDGDGKIDLVVANFGANKVSFHKGNGDGTFQAAVEKTTTYPGPVRVRAAFANGDGFRDVAVACQDGTSGGFEVLLGNGDGSFAASAAHQVALNSTNRFALGRWEGDQVDDVALIRTSSSVLPISTYKFGTPPTLIEDNNDLAALLIDVVAGDFDGDGVADLAVLVRASPVDFSNYLMFVRKTHTAPAFISGAATLATTVTQAPGGNMSQFIATGLPLPTYSYMGGGLPTGMALNLTTGAITGAPALGTTGLSWFIDLQASNDAGGTATRTINITVAKATQAVAFTPSDMQYSFGPVQLTATSPASSGTFTWDSLTPSVCTMSGAFVTSVAVGTCTVTVLHNGDNDYLASPVVQKSFAIQPASQTITFTAPAARRLGDGAFAFGNGGNTGTASSSAGLTPIAVGTLTPLTCTVSSPVVTPVAVGLCRLTLDQAGNAIYGPAAQQVAEFSVNPNTAPGAPTATVINRGNGSATVHFFGATDNGGASISNYIATCMPGTIQSALSLNSPLIVSGLTNGTLYSCSVQAINAVGTGAASNALNVTPALTPQITSGSTAAFTRLQFGSFTFTATGDPAPTFSVTGTLPAGLSLDAATGVLSGTPALGSAQAMQVEIKATNVGGVASYFPTITVARLPQAISFTQPANKPFGSGNAQMTATATASGPVTFGVTTPSICTSAGSNAIQLLALGTCTVTANHNGDLDYTAAPQVTRSFNIIASVPDTPGVPQVIPGDGKVTIHFTVPLDGGAPIIGYSVTCNPGNHVASGPASPLTVTGLANGTQYSCAVRASNSSGESLPNNVSVIPGKLAQTISFTQPANVAFGSVPSVTLTATATSGTPVTFTSSTPPVCTIQNPNTAVLVAVGTCTVIASHPGNADYDPAPSVTRSFSVTSADVPQLQASASALSFGAQSMGTTSPSMPVTVTNTGTGTLTVSSVSSSNAQFAQANNCTSVAPSSTCTINVTFSPTVGAGGLNATAAITGTLSIASNAAGSPHAVSLSGTAEKSLVTHYYRSILRRAPDAGGAAFWAAEAARVAALNVNVSEVWFAMAQQFYFSPEYAALNRDDTGYITDLYNTFFNRAPDTAGLNFWLGNLAGGMPREVALAEFMFSTEFGNFTGAIFGNTAARAEVNTVVDFYRGLLARLPDDGGFAFWLGKFRAAQCTQPASAAAAAITAQVEAISQAYTQSTEYSARGRTNAQYVGDLYNAFLRRGGDLGGVLFWIGQVTTGARTRETVRIDFKNSPEFQARVQAIIAQGCL